MSDNIDWKKYMDNPDYEIRVGYILEPMPLTYNHFTDVIVCIGGIGMRIPSKQWNEKQEYDRLKRKWSWLD
jgi:hypothetical protein